MNFAEARALKQHGEDIAHMKTVIAELLLRIAALEKRAADNPAPRLTHVKR